MSKLEYSPINDFTKFNFLGKRLFDFVNDKINISTGTYLGNGASQREIPVDIIPRFIVVVNNTMVFWMDQFDPGEARYFDGSVAVDEILGLTITKDKFIIGSNINLIGTTYHWIAFGS